jgi:hypothetical protein
MNTKIKDETLARCGLFATKTMDEAITFTDQVIASLPEEDRATAYTLVYVMYNSVIAHYETNMICTANKEK